MATNQQTGLSEREVLAQVEAGNVNTTLVPLTRTVGQIVKTNTFTLFNLVNVVLGAIIFTTGSYKNLLFLGVAVVNTAIGTFQEIRAKKQVDSLTILNQATATVLRDGVTVAIPQEQLVVGDLLLLKRGDQVPVDGHVISGGNVEIDESQLTGEPNAIRKTVGNAVMSGSFVVAGTLTMEVEKVGARTFAAGLALEAKAEKAASSQLLSTVNRIIRVLTYVLIPLGLALFTVSMVRRGDYSRAVLTTSAAVIGMIPEGLVLLTNVALAVGSRNLAKQRVLVRGLTPIEALARVDTICLDKTGTITSGKLRVRKLVPEPRVTPEYMQKVAAAVVYALNDDNETALAIKAYAQQKPFWTVAETVPFNSARKWSGASFSDGSKFFIGAPEFTLAGKMPPAAQAAADAAAAKGFRVLVLGTADSISDGLVNPKLLGMIQIADELRPTAVQTFNFFTTQGVTLKVISGDNPITVSNVAVQAHIPNAAKYINMAQVADDTDFGALMNDYTVFGRVTPQQKKRLIAEYQQQGHTVAMTGDGVNDVLALRQADCSIAMATGADAASAIADFVLLDSNFDAMTGVLNEGRRVINNIESVASLFLIKTMYSTALAAIFLFINADFPIVPINLTPVSAVAIAIPSFLLTLEPNFARVSGQFMAKVMTFAAPAAIAVVLYTLAITWLEWALKLDFDSTSTIVVMLIATISFNVLFRVSRPLNRYKVGMNMLVGLALLVVFFVLNDVFSLHSLWNWHLLAVYGPLVVSTVPVYLLIQEFLGRRVLSRINWR